MGTVVVEGVVVEEAAEEVQSLLRIAST